MAQINKPTDYFNTKLYTGNGSTQSITGVGFQPDFTWIKNRSSGYSHCLYDVVRTATKRLKSNSSNAEDTDTNGLTAFDLDGFSVGSSASQNASGENIVAWNWLGANGTASNTDGDITSTVSANTTSGFSIVKFTANGSNNGTIGHGLGSTPAIVIYKRLDGTGSWYVLYTFVDGSQDYLILDSTSAKADLASSTYGTATSSTISNIGFGNTNSMIAYCFAEKKGFSKFGSYTGNGSTDGTFVYTGFKTAWVITKRTDSPSDWVILDNKRNSFNVVDKKLESSNSDADTTQTACDFLSNGIKLKDTTTSYLGTNISGGTYIYMAFAESPLVGTNNIPAVAR